MAVAPGAVIEDFNVSGDLGPGQIPGFIYSLSEKRFLADWTSDRVAAHPARSV